MAKVPKVFIGVGHGGSDPGAVANGIKEKDANLVIATECYNVLSRHKVTVQMSRYKDEDESLNEKVNECNKFAPDYALDIHNNAGGGDGAEVYYYKGSTKGKNLATQILNAIVKLGQNSRGVKQNTSFAFLKGTVCPAVLVECAFLDNKTDVQIIDTAAEQKAMGVAIAKGILATLGITYVEEVSKPAVDVSKYEAEIKSLKEQNKALQSKIDQIKAIVQ
jgi:N-acetylmuramoyl-L-alanine amidase